MAVVSGQWSRLVRRMLAEAARWATHWVMKLESQTSASTINVKRQPPRAALVACRFVLTLTLSV